jgi:hypothetical protein
MNLNLEKGTLVEEAQLKKVELTAAETTLIHLDAQLLPLLEQENILKDLLRQLEFNPELLNINAKIRDLELWIAEVEQTSHLSEPAPSPEAPVPEPSAEPAPSFLQLKDAVLGRKRTPSTSRTFDRILLNKLRVIKSRAAK